MRFELLYTADQVRFWCAAAALTAFFLGLTLGLAIGLTVGRRRGDYQGYTRGLISPQRHAYRDRRLVPVDSDLTGLIEATAPNRLPTREDDA